MQQQRRKLDVQQQRTKTLVHQHSILMEARCATVQLPYLYRSTTHAQCIVGHFALFAAHFPSSPFVTCVRIALLCVRTAVYVAWSIDFVEISYGAKGKKKRKKCGAFGEDSLYRLIINCPFSLQFLVFHDTEIHIMFRFCLHLSF